MPLVDLPESLLPMDPLPDVAQPAAGEDSPQVASVAGAEVPGPRPRFQPIDRAQLRWVELDIDQMVGPDHVVRDIWRLIQTLDLDAYEQPIKAVEGVAGRCRTDVRLLISVWVYAFSRGITSGREIERQMSYEPGLRWLAASEVIGYHTLNDFRSQNEGALKHLFTEVLAAMKAEGLIEIRRAFQDGSKVKAAAGSDSFRRRKSLEEHLVETGEQVEAMMREAADPALSAKQAAARQKAVEDRQRRLKSAEKQLVQIEETRKKNQKKGRGGPETARVSETDPDARIMKMAGEAIGPAYNAQLVVDGAHGLIVGSFVSQAASDSELLQRGVEVVEQMCGQKPSEVVADDGYTTCANVVEMAKQNIEFYGSAQTERASRQAETFTISEFCYHPETDSYQCPAGKTLKHRRDEQDEKTGRIDHHYRARRSDCAGCPLKTQCCPKARKNGRTLRWREQPEAMRAYIAKMQTDEARAIYRQRAQRAEFPSAWIKSRFNLRQFRLRGLIKVGMEWMWVCLTFNLLRWAKLRLPAAAPAG